MRMSHIRPVQARPQTAADSRCSVVTRRGRGGRTTFAPIWLLVSLVVSFSLLGALSASAISRDTTLERAQRRIDRPVTYSQARYYAGYRTDCSGYVSMCWATNTSWNTRTFYRVTHAIPVSSLKPGDALLKKGYHIRLFYGWVDDAHTEYVAYESTGGFIAGCRIHSISEDLAFGYVPVRYDRISNSPTPSNVLRNGSFNVWARSWGSQPENPVWWQTGGSWWQTVAVHRKDVYRSTHSSLKLVNSSGDPAAYTELSQSVPVVAGAYYRLTAWAKSPYDPNGLQLRLTYLNAAGQSVAETSTTGDRFGTNAASFRKMTLLLASPPNAVKALVSVRLAGGTTTSTVGSTVRGTSATLDDVSLARPRVTVGIRTSATTAYNGRTVSLSGVVAPASAIGAPAVVFVQKPGSGWTQLSTSTVVASDGSAMWKARVTFTSGMRRGTYWFKTTIPRIPGYLGATTTAVAVKLK